MMAVARAPGLSLRQVVVAYGEQVILPGIDLHIPAGTLTGVIGPNGAGKTTLIKAMLGLIPIQSGEIQVGGHRVRRRGGKVAYVPQSDSVNLRFPATVFDVALMGRTGRLGWLRWPGPEDRAAAAKALAEVDMLDHRDVPIDALSGGQRQRVYLARALAGEPEVLLLDEPLTGIDAPTQDALFDILERLAAQGKTILATTHDLRCRIERFDLLLALNRQVVAFGSPAQVFTAEVLGRTYGQQVVTADGVVATVLTDPAALGHSQVDGAACLAPVGDRWP